MSHPLCSKCKKRSCLAWTDEEGKVVEYLTVCRDCICYATYVPITEQIVLRDERNYKENE